MIRITRITVRDKNTEKIIYTEKTDYQISLKNLEQERKIYQLQFNGDKVFFNYVQI
jgi:hypothetical protein